MDAHFEYTELPVYLGKAVELTGRPAYLMPDDQGLSMQIMGLPKSGKSKFMENMIRQDILNNRGLCLIDPHGSLVDDILKWLAENPWLVEDKKIVILDPADKEFSFGFNPFAKEMEPEEIEYYVTSLVETVIGIWDDGDSFSKPLIKEALTAVFYLLMVKQLSLSQAFQILDFDDDSKIRREFIESQVIDNPSVQHFFSKLSKFKRVQDFDGAFNGSDRRVSAVLFNSMIRRIFSNQNHIDIKKLMDEGAVILVPMSSRRRVGKDDGKIFAALLINEIYREGLGREVGSAWPFTLYVDECHLYMRGDIEYMLSELRKFHVSVVLAHQWLTQIKDPELRKGIVNGCQTKVIFRIGEYDDAFYWAKNLFRYSIDRVKQWTYQLIGHEIIELQGESDSVGFVVTDTEGLSQSVVDTVTKGSSKTEAESRGKSDTRSTTESSSSFESSSWGEVVSVSSGASEMFYVDEDTPVVLGLPETINQFEGESSSISSGGGSGFGESFSESDSSTRSRVWTIAEAVSESIAKARGETVSRSTSRGSSSSKTLSINQTLMPVLRRVPQSFVSVDDQRHQRAEQILDLPRAHCIVQAGIEKAILLRTAFTESAFVEKTEFEAFVRTLKERTDDLFLISEGERAVSVYVIEEEAPFEMRVLDEGEDE